MGDINDADSAGAQVFDDFEESFRLLELETRGRLVHDEDTGVGRESLGDLDELLSSDREIADESRRTEFESDAIEKLARAGRYLIFVDQSEAGGFATEEEISADAEIGREVEFLMNEGDAMAETFLDGANRDFISLNPYRPRIGPLHAGEDFHEGTFPCPIFPEHGDDLALAHGEADLMQSAHAGK